MKWPRAIALNSVMLLFCRAALIILIGLVALNTTTLYAQESTDEADEQKTGIALWKAIQTSSINTDADKNLHRQRSAAQFKAIEQRINQLTSFPLTDQSTLYFRHDGFKIETLYKQGITTKFKADDDGDVSFTVKFSF